MESRSRSGFFAFFLIPAFCILRLSTIAFGATVDSPSLSAQSPAVAVPVAASFNFGCLARGESVQHGFVITNNGDTPLAIAKVRPSCDCLRVMSYPRRISPKSQGAIMCRLVPDKVGAVTYKLFVESADPNLPVRVLAIEGKVTAESSGKKAIDVEWAAIAPNLLCRVITPRDASCYMTAQILKSRLDAGEAIRMIDVRPASVFNDLHVPSSWNITVFALKAQIQLKSVPLVLIDSCGGDPTLEQACRDLRKNGFASVWILGGGLNAWRQAGGALEGSPAAIEQVVALTPAVFEQARHFNDWLVVTAGEKQAVLSAFLFPDAVPIEYAGDFKLSPDEASASASSVAQVLNILLLADEGDTVIAKRIALLKQKSGVRVYTLAGGLPAYEAYLRTCSTQPATRSLNARAKTGLIRGSSVKKSCGGCS